MAGSSVKGPGVVALLLVQVVLGYEWFVSGLTKLVRGGFPQASRTSSGRCRRVPRLVPGLPG
jgi:uncharacterized membrane protein YphA (DoxX/SURF4 family)